MKKVLITILVVLLIAAGVAGGWLWYHNAHVFVEDAVYAKNEVLLDLRGQDISRDHFDTAHAQLPQTEILWDVPFQGGKVSSDSQTLTITTLTQDDIAMLAYFPGLTQVNAEGCGEYALLEQLKNTYPNLEVHYQVSLGSTWAAPSHAELTLPAGGFDFDTLLENLKYLPQLTSLTLEETDLTREQLELLAETYGAIDIGYTVNIGGQAVADTAAELNLSQLTSDQVAQAARQLSLLPQVTAVELMDAEGNTALTLEDVKTLKEAAPHAAFHYVFDFYGHTISTTDEEVYISNARIGDQGLPQVRQVLDVMENCKRFVLDSCRISNENMAQLREDYRDKTKVVWRVTIARMTSLTDVEVMYSINYLEADNCHNLIYCEDVVYMDIGHNEQLTTLEFVAGMPKLEVVIASGSPITDLTPFENCPNLRVLEIAFCQYVTDLTPLKSCSKLEMLNLGYVKVKDLSPLDEHKMVLLCLDRSSVSAAERKRFAELQPDCWITWDDKQPYNSGWRYTKDSQKLPWYEEIAKIFRYPTPRNSGYYLADVL